MGSQLGVQLQHQGQELFHLCTPSGTQDFAPLQRRHLREASCCVVERIHRVELLRRGRAQDLHDLEQLVNAILASEERLMKEHLSQNAARRPHVHRGCVIPRAQNELGGAVETRANVGLRNLVVGYPFGSAKVADLQRVASGIHKQIGRLDISMYHALPAQAAEPSQELVQVDAHKLEVHFRPLLTVVLDDPPQRVLNVLQYEVQSLCLWVRTFKDTEQVYNVWAAVEVPQDFQLSAGAIEGDSFDRHRLAGAHLGGLADGPKGAPAKHAQGLIPRSSRLFPRLRHLHRRMELRVKVRSNRGRGMQLRPAGQLWWKGFHIRRIQPPALGIMDVHEAICFAGA
mmetsp:Transcript_66858/g.159547  ORF Transcript_66858/g.159547 Transcript_66858/m.159547 type:complete len:342 (-) Transcript_66858:33-1058(-)